MPVKTSYAPGEPTWIDLGSPDLDRSVAFYSALFGWTWGGGNPDFGGYGMFFLDGKNICGAAPLMSPEQPPVWTCYVSTDDADKTVALATAAGATVVAPVMDIADLGRMAVFLDPAGAALGIWQPRAMTGADLVLEEGTLSWIENATRDQAAALPFYQRVFGWGADVQDTYTELTLGGTSVAGCMDMPEAVPAAVPSYWMPFFGAADPRAKAEQAASLGATVLVPYQEIPDGSFSVVQDPHGTSFGLLHLSG